jgi:hypothetical protein
MLRVIMQNIYMLRVIMLNTVMLRVVSASMNLVKLPYRTRIFVELLKERLGGTFDR